MMYDIPSNRLTFNLSQPQLPETIATDIVLEKSMYALSWISEGRGRLTRFPSTR